MVEVLFDGIYLTVPNVENAKAAYDKLAAALEQLIEDGVLVDYGTDTYTFFERTETTGPCVQGSTDEFLG